jgi:hypothetical protein
LSQTIRRTMAREQCLLRQAPRHAPFMCLGTLWATKRATMPASYLPTRPHHSHSSPPTLTVPLVSQWFSTCRSRHSFHRATTSPRHAPSQVPLVEVWSDVRPPALPPVTSHAQGILRAAPQADRVAFKEIKLLVSILHALPMRSNSNLLNRMLQRWVSFLHLDPSIRI